MLSLTPPFDPDVTSYTATTTNATNMLTAVPEDAGATVKVFHEGAEVPNGTAITWEDGENAVTIEVENGEVSETYRVTVTKA